MPNAAIAAIPKPIADDDPRFMEADPCTVQAWMEAGEIVLVDVRETTEYEQEHIPGSVLCPLSVFDAELFPRIPGKRLVLHCALGKRSAAAGKQLLKAGYPEITNLVGGIQAWKAAGCPTEVQLGPPEAKGELPLMPVAAQHHPAPPSLPSGVHPGMVLNNEFIEPLGMTMTGLARAIGVPPGRISAIVAGKRTITAETAIRLARHLCTTDEFWLRLQSAHDLEKARAAIGERLRREVQPRQTGARQGAARPCG